MDLHVIWSERNNAVRACNVAIAEKRQAMADRDIAILQRDAAVADRDNARIQRDNAIARLQLKTNSMNATSGFTHSPSSSECNAVMLRDDDTMGQLQRLQTNSMSDMIHNLSESKERRMQRDDDVIGQSRMKTNSMNPLSVVMYNPAERGESMSRGVVQKQQQPRQQHIVNYSEIAFKPVEVPFSDVFTQSSITASKSTKAKKRKRGKETKTVSSSKTLKQPTRETKTVSPNKASKPVRDTKTVSPSTKALKPTRKISKRGTKLSNMQIVVASQPPSSDSGTNGHSGNLEKQVAVIGGLSLNELGLDYANLPVPYCTCTGNPQSCYKWGKGGWQSACCTTTLSVYPLPQMPNKRHSRMGGRKMSGGAFTKLIMRLASEGHDITAPIDLKNHWARHGTNRYIIIR